MLPARNPPPIRCPIPHRIRSASRLPKSYNRSNMQPAFSTPFPEPLPAAMPQLSEKPRHGVRSWNPAPHPGHFLCNSRTAIGLQFGRSGNVSGTVVAPNNSQQPQPQQPKPEPKPGWCTALNHAGNTTVALGGATFLWGTLADAGVVTAPAGVALQASGGIGMAVGGIGIGIADAGLALGICH